MIRSMQDSSREDRARRIVGWQQSRHKWDGSWDYYQCPKPFSGRLSPIQLIDPLLLPPLLSRAELIETVFPSVVLVQRMATADWIKPTHQTVSGEPLFTREDLYKALDALLRGERPPVPANEPPRPKGTPELGRLVGPKECAKFLNVSERTLRYYAEKKIIPSYRPGKHRRYDLGEVKDALKRTHHSADLKRLLR